MINILKNKCQFFLFLPLWRRLGWVFVLFLSACTKDITINQIPYEGKTSIQSLITPDSLPKVYVYRAVPFFDTRISVSQLVRRDVTVSMTDGNENISFTLDSVFNVPTCEYFIFWKGNKKIKANKTYTLSVIDKVNIFTAQATTNQEVIPIDSISYVTKFQDLYGEHEGVVVSFRDKIGIGSYYRYQMDRIIPDSIVNPGGVLSPCSVGKNNPTQEIGRTIYPDENLDGQPISFVFEPTYKHKKGQVAYVRLQIVDKNIYKFYDNLDRSKLNQYNPFVEPVFVTQGQFGDKAIGVFGAYSISKEVKFVYPE
jgi:hypothetical protein